MSDDGKIDGKLVIFCYKGGPRDGDESRSDVMLPPNGIPGEVYANWDMTQKGALGKRIPAISPHDVGRLNEMAFAGRPVDQWRIHYYEVVDRQETDEKVVVTCEYRDNEGKKA